MRSLIRTRADLAGLVIVSAALLLGIIGPWVAPYDPEHPIAGAQLQAPSAEHLFGTDENGMDVFSRVIAAARIDLTIALAGTLGAVILGVLIGLAAGYARRFGGSVIMRVTDVVQAFPVFLLGMALVIASGQNISNVIYAIAILNAPIYARLTRSQVLFLREQTFVEAARAGGVPGWRILFAHVLPNALGPAVAMISVTIGFSMLLTSGLSFVGAGVRPPTAEWGSMIAVGAGSIYTGEWWPSVFPGLALTTTVFGFALLTDMLSRFADPRKQAVGVVAAPDIRTAQSGRDDAAQVA